MSEILQFVAIVFVLLMVQRIMIAIVSRIVQPGRPAKEQGE